MSDDFKDDDYLSPAQVRDFLQISRPTFDKIKKWADFPKPVMLGQNTARWQFLEIKEWLKTRSK